MSQPDQFTRVAATDGVRKDLRSKSVRGAASMAAGGVGDIVIRLGSTFVLARLLLPEHFGIVGMVTAVTAIATQFSQLGLSTATVQRKDITHQQVTNLFWINTAFGALLSLVICALAPAIAAFYRDPRLIPVTMVISLSFFWGGLTVQHDALLDRQMKQSKSALIRLVATIASACTGIFLAYHGYGYWALAWQEVVRSFLIAAGVWYFCRWIPGLPSRSADVRSLLGFGVNLALAQMISTIVSNLDRLLIGRFFGAVPVGVYRQAQQLIMAPIDQLNTPIQSVSQPGLSMLQDNPERYRGYYKKILLVIGLSTMPVAVFAGVYAYEIVDLVLGPKWAATAPLFRIFAIAAFVRPALSTSGVVMITCGQTGRLLRFTLVRNACLTLFVAIGVNWGAVGTATATVVNTLALALPSLFYGYARSPVKVATFFRGLRTPLIASAAMLASLVAYRSIVPGLGTFAAISSGFVVGAVAFGATCLALTSGRAEIFELLHDVVASVPALRFIKMPAPATSQPAE